MNGRDCSIYKNKLTRPALINHLSLFPSQETKRESIIQERKQENSTMSKADRIRKNRRLSKPLSQNPSPNTEPHQYVQYLPKTINKTQWSCFILIHVYLFFFLIIAGDHSFRGNDSLYSIVHSRFVGYLSKHYHEIMESNYKPVKQKGNPYYSENFTTNYYQMERKFKVYMYPEDEVLNKYYQNGSEGYFFKNIKDSQFRTTIAQEAHLFFIPIRTHQMHNMVYLHIFFQGTTYHFVLDFYS